MVNSHHFSFEVVFRISFLFSSHMETIFDRNLFTNLFDDIENVESNGSFHQKSKKNSVFSINLQAFKLNFQTVTMAPGSKFFDLWQKSPAVVLVQFRIFNVTNSDEFLSGRDAKLKIVEVGPYVFQ